MDIAALPLAGEPRIPSLCERTEYAVRVSTAAVRLLPPMPMALSLGVLVGGSAGLGALFNSPTCCFRKDDPKHVDVQLLLIATMCFQGGVAVGIASVKKAVTAARQYVRLRQEVEGHASPFPIDYANAALLTSVALFAVGILLEASGDDFYEPSLPPIICGAVGIGISYFALKVLREI